MSATGTSAHFMTEDLFSYGTLQSSVVQEANFGWARPVNPDALLGFRIEPITIIDAEVIEASETNQHPILRCFVDVADVADVADVVGAMVLELTSDELRASDEYEVDDYRRIEVTLASARRARVYVADEFQI